MIFKLSGKSALKKVSLSILAVTANAFVKSSVAEETVFEIIKLESEEEEEEEEERRRLFKTNCTKPMTLSIKTLEKLFY